MSPLVKENSDFIGLLLSTTSLQAQALLDTVTAKQVQVISQIARNLLETPLGDEAKKEVANNRKLIGKLGDVHIGVTKKARFIGIHRKRIIAVLRAAKTLLQAVISQPCDTQNQDNLTDT